MNKVPIVEFKREEFSCVRKRVQLGRITIKRNQAEGNLKNVKSKKGTARRSVILKSASWYANVQRCFRLGLAQKTNPGNSLNIPPVTRNVRPGPRS